MSMLNFKTIEADIKYENNKTYLYRTLQFILADMRYETKMTFTNRIMYIYFPLDVLLFESVLFL